MKRPARRSQAFCLATTTRLEDFPTRSTIRSTRVPPQDEYDVTKGFTYLYFTGKPQFAFGHGLSYSTFRYSGLKVSPGQTSANGKVTVSLDVQNTGTRAGDEVVQLYVHALQASVKRPIRNYAASSAFT